MRAIGVVVNPVAGLGGRVGLKGTDGKVAEALERGAEPRAGDRAEAALAALRDATAGDGIELFAAGGSMGADSARAVGFEPTVVTDPPSGLESTAADTREAVRAFVDRDVDLIFFGGGDGTAADVATTLDQLDDETPILGVPAGVKVYSAVFAVSPEAAGRAAATFERTEWAEVNDIDEEEYRGGELRTTLRAVACVPAVDTRQSAKQSAGGSVAGLAEGFCEEAREGVTYVLGPGSTVGQIEATLGVEGTALGVDVYRDGELVVRDGAESGILGALSTESVVVVSPIGGQGFVFGRGNQQLSPAVIRQSSVEIVASRRKLDGLGVLRADTGDPALDEQLRGWHRVRVGRVEQRLVELV